MRDLMAELKELRLHGMATAWEELASQGEVDHILVNGCSNICFNKSIQIERCAR